MISTIGAFVRMVLLGFFTLTVLLYAVKHGVGGFGLGDFAPSYAVFIALVPILFFNSVGFEPPSTAGEEMTNPQRDVPFAVIRSAFGRRSPPSLSCGLGSASAGFGTAGRSNNALVGLGFKGQRLQFELSQFVPLAFFLRMGVVFYLMGKRTREQVVDIPFSEELAKDGHRG